MFGHLFLPALLATAIFAPPWLAQTISNRLISGGVGSIPLAVFLLAIAVSQRNLRFSVCALLLSMTFALIVVGSELSDLFLGQSNFSLFARLSVAGHILLLTFARQCN